MKTWIAEQSWAQRIGYSLGAVYVLIGAVGFVITAGLGFFESAGKDLIIFELNPLHNVVHLLIGGALLYAARAGASASRLMNTLIGGTYLLVGIAGAFIVQMDPAPGLTAVRSEVNILALNHPDNLLHVASAIVLVGAALLGRRRQADRVVEVQAPVVRAKPPNKASATRPTTKKSPVRKTKQAAPKQKAAPKRKVSSGARSSQASRGSRR